jgi:CubicO group peptidase (beta-lactamase class C family)
MKKLLFLLFVAHAATAQPPTPAQVPAPAQVQQVIATANLPGIQLIYTHGDSTMAYNLGSIGAGSKQPVTTNTIFEAASLSKSVFAYIVLRLYDRGLINLDAPLLPLLGSYPRFDPNDPRYGRITARMVLRHTTGLPNWGDSAGARLLFPPDSTFSYSGEGYVFLQRVVEKITGKTLNELAQEEVFTPLKMTSTSYCWIPKFDSVSAFGHDSSQIKRHQNQNAAYSLLTNAHDYTIFLQALAAGRGLKPKTHRMMLAPSIAARWFNHPVTEATGNIAWALGVSIQHAEPEPYEGFPWYRPLGQAFWHWGDNGSFKAFYIVFPETHETLVYFVHDYRGLFVTQELYDLFFVKDAKKHPCWAIRWSGEGYSKPWSMDTLRTTAEKANFDPDTLRQLAGKPNFQLTENDLNEYGFLLMDESRLKEAAAIFKLNLRLHPESANAFDSMAEAYEKLGEKTLALENFKRSYELNPKNDYAAKHIKDLQSSLQSK